MPRRRNPNPRPPGRPAKYPWSQWLNGETHVLYPRADFDGDLESMRHQIYNRARKEDVPVSVQSFNGGLAVTADVGGVRTGTNARYDWESLFDGEIKTLLVGRDIQAQPESFRQYARRMAIEYGGRLESRKIGNTISLRFVPDAPEPEPTRVKLPWE